MLSFISFWRAAAIVLNDLGSSAFYVGGIAEQAIGKSGPWFILGVMLFSYAVRAVYIESCSMFVRGGVYRVVREVMGPVLAKAAVSALLFDYVLTGPISGVSAGLYLGGLVNDTISLFGGGFRVHPPSFAVGFAVLATVYFWRQNIRGITESSHKALRIMQLTTVMVVLMILWCLATILVRGFQPVPLPTASNLHLSNEALGWLAGTRWPQITLIAILIGLGHSVLAMSGEETLAQVNREIAAPKLKNLERAGFIIFLYSLLFTSLVSFFAVMIIPDAVRSRHFENLIGGLAMSVLGPSALKLVFHAFVVLVGTLLLSGAVNTAIVGSNGVLNRVAEDRVLPDWFRRPHGRFGTTYRFINAVVLLQIVTIIASRGDVFLLGEAYAFGVMWSFCANSLAVLLLRFKMPDAPAWKVPLNLRLGGREIPIGLVLITLTLFALAVTNLFTKKIATVAGIGFTAAIFAAFQITESVHRRKEREDAELLEEFRLDAADDLSASSAEVRLGNTLVAVKNPHRLAHLRQVVERTDTGQTDIAVLTVRHTGDPSFGEWEPTPDEVFSTDVAYLFTRVVSEAEAAGKPVKLMAVTGRDVSKAIMETAHRVGARTVVLGQSNRMSPAAQAKTLGDAWETLPRPRPNISVQIWDPEGQETAEFILGPHPPGLQPEDQELLHRMWLELSRRGLGPDLHHRDVARCALQRLDAALHTREGDVIVEELRASLARRSPAKRRRAG